MWSTILFAVSLLAISAALIFWHLLAWRRADHGGLTDADYRFYRRQFRRRMQASAMLGLVGVFALADLFVQDVVLRAILWCLILMIVLWTLVLAGSDWLASRLHFDKLLSASAVEHALLKREIEKFRREQEQAPPRDTSNP